MAMKPVSSPQMRRTDDYLSMIRLGKRSGLEGEDLKNVAVAYGYYVDEELIACVALKELEGVYTVECLAVDEKHRKMGLGSKLLMKIEQDATNDGATRLWALARQPGFFLANGFHEAMSGERGAPTTESCLGCQQYGKTCSPVVMVKDLEPNRTTC